MIPVLTRSRYRVISLDIDTGGLNEVVDSIIEQGKNRTPSYVCFANVHMVIEAYDAPEFAGIVNRATYVLPDGMPLVKFLGSVHNVDQPRLAGMDLFPIILAEAARKQASVYLFGTTNELLAKIVERAARELPDLKIAGTCSPAFNESLDQKKYIDEINESGANLVFVALGCPKQEKWMAKHSSSVRGIMLGVGGAFAVYGGKTSRAPVFMQKAGLEWLYRLAQEPRRLLKRYFITNSKFIYLALKEKSRRKKK